MDGRDMAAYEDAGEGGAKVAALYVVFGKGRFWMSSCDGEGACDMRKPICTVAEEAIEDSLRWRGWTPIPPNWIRGGGVNSLMSYIESFCPALIGSLPSGGKME